MVGTATCEAIELVLDEDQLGTRLEQYQNLDSHLLGTNHMTYTDPEWIQQDLHLGAPYILVLREDFGASLGKSSFGEFTFSPSPSH